MEVRLLGPVELWAGGRRLGPDRPQRAAALAALAVDAGRLVTTEALIDRIWGDDSPAAPGPAIHAIVARIRRMLRDAAMPGEAAPVLESKRGGGYVLRIEPRDVDLLRFRATVAVAKNPNEAERAGVLDDALALWQGTPLAGVPGAWAARMRESWNLERLDAAIEWAKLELRLGRHERVIGRVRGLLAEHPLAEPLTAVLMRALTAAGRTAEALECYASVRERLVDQLGSGPGKELRSLHEQILRGEPAAAAPTTVGRNDLPRDVPDFTGRAFEIRMIDSVARETGPGAAVMVVAVDGMAGVGKTALAVHAAHRLTGHYPDGQLLVDLRGHTAGQEPATPAVVLDALLRAVGVPGDQVPDDLDQRAGLWRARLAGRRVLLVLDNAANAAQVRPLLPGTAGSLTVITSRRRLTDLDAAHVISLDVLPPGDGTALFGRIAGHAHAAADPGAVAEVVRLCGLLPLAIRIAAARLRTRTAWTAPDLARRLAERRGQLSELVAGDRSVSAAFALSYQHLSADQARLFRLLGLIPGPDIDVNAAAALAGYHVDHAQALIEDLVDVHLLQQPAPGRYRFHDLLRSHADEVAQADEPAAEVRAATGRLLDYYLEATKQAAGWIDPRGVRIEVSPAHPPAHLPDLDDRARATDWLDTERANLVAAIAYAAGNGWLVHAWQLPHLLQYHFHIRGRIDEWFSTHQQALTAARLRHDRFAEAETLKNLGLAGWVAMRFDDAIAYHEQALVLYQAASNEAGESDILNNLGLVYDRLGRYDEAILHYRRALELRLRTGKRRGEAATLQNLANVLSQLGRPDEAVEHHERSLAILRDLGDRGGEAIVLGSLAITRLFLKEYDEALRDCRASITLADEVGDQWSKGNALETMGNAYRGLGRYDDSIEVLLRALAIARTGGARGNEDDALVSLGDSYHAAGRGDQASDAYRQALRLAAETRYRLGEARARRGLSRVLSTTDPDMARQHRQRALAIFTELGVPEARDLLADSEAR